MAAVNSQLRSLVTPDGAVILDAKQNLVITVNTVGGYIWGKLQDGNSIESIVHDLAQQTGADAASVERDVREFIEDLTRKHLVTPSAMKRF